MSDNKAHGALIKTPFRYWKDAISAFDNHFHNARSDRTERARGYETHQKCCAKALEVKQVLDNEQVSEN